MAPAWQAYPSGSTTGIDLTDRTLVDPWESIGEPKDAKATNIADENSAFSLAKGICDGLGVSVGAGTGTVNTAPRVYADLLKTLGNVDDAPAGGSGALPWSAIALLKGILVTTGLP